MPAIPIANPTSAFFNAGASFVPSPVTATTSPRSLNPVTSAYLSYGLLRAKTSNLSLILSKASAFNIVSTLTSFPVYYACFESRAHSQIAVLHFLQTTPPINLLKSMPSITKQSEFSVIMPTSFAIARAVMMLSPVTIRTVIPARWHFLIASGTSFLGMSCTPRIAIAIKFDF